MAKAKAIPHVDPEASLFVHAAVAIGTRVDELIAYEPFLADAEQVYELHQMRIAAKRLRYTMDLFLPAFNEFSRHGADFTAVLSQIKLIQQYLGDIHDADVLVPQLLAQISKLLTIGHGKEKHGEDRVGVHLADLDAAQGLLSLCTSARDRRDAAFSGLQADWKRMQDEELFQGLRKTLRAAVTDETLAAVLHDAPSASPASAIPGTLPTSGAVGLPQKHDEPGINGGAVNEGARSARSIREGKRGGKRGRPEPDI